MPMTVAEFIAKNKGAGNASSTPSTTPTKIPISDWIQQAKNAPPPPPPKPKTAGGLINGLFSGAKQLASDSLPATVAGVKQMGQGFQQTEEGATKGNASLLGRGILNETAGGINTIVSPVTNILQNAAKLPGVSNTLDAIKKYVTDPTANAISKSPALQKFMTTHPNADEVASNLITIALGFMGGDKAPEIKTSTEPIVSTATKVAEKVKEAPSDFYKKQSINDWTKPVTANMPGFKKPAQIFKNAASQGHNIADTLVENGIKLSDNIEDGRYVTADTAASLREDTGKFSADLLRPSLEAADKATPKTPISNIIARAKQSISNDKELTAGDKETAISKINKEKIALDKKHPDGVSLVDKHDNKITYSKNAGHNPLGTMADNVSAKANDAIATAFKNILEESAPKDIPLKEFNKELQKGYQAADYLESLHTKKAPVSLASKIAKTTAKVVGATVGETLGGGILAGVGGYHLGGMLEGALENMSDPLKSMILSNIEKTNPQAFAKIKTFLGDQETARLTRKALPAPRPLGSSENPIIPPAPTTYESQASEVRTTRTNKTGDQYVRNKKTGELEIIPKKQ